MRRRADELAQRLAARSATVQLVYSGLRKRGGLSGALTVNFVGGITIQLALLISGTVLARALGPENRGNMALLTLASATAWQLGGFGIPLALTYAAARAPGSARRSYRSVRGPIAFQATLAAVAAAIVLNFLTAGRPDYVRVGAALTSLAIFATVYERCALGVIQGLRKFVVLNVFRCASNVLFAIIAATLWLADVHDFLPYAIDWAVSQSIVAPIAIVFAIREANRAAVPGAEPASKRELLRFGRKSFFGGSPPVETYRLDQSVVAVFLAPVELGYYVAAVAFTNLPRFAAQSFALVATPIVAGRRNHAAAIKTMWRFFWVAVPFYLIPVAILWLAAPTLVTFFFGHDFGRAGEISRILLPATALFCARRVLSDSARGAGYPGIGSLAEGIAFLAVIPLFAIFVPAWGLDGVAWALVASSTIALAILVGGLVHLTGTGRVPESWSSIHETSPLMTEDVELAGQAGS
jgi:O-antigen/teichoic acid export membrane protein